MTVDSSMADVVAAFKSRGFRYVSRTQFNSAKLTGILVTSHSNHECDVYIPADFSSPPIIKLVTLPPELLPIAPHIGPDKSICYLTNSTITLDIFDPVGQMLACLDRAAFVLNQILTGEIENDLAEEFFSYWGSEEFLCFYDVASENPSKVVCLADLEKTHKTQSLFLTDDAARTCYKAAGIGHQLTQMDVVVARISTSTYPRPSLLCWPITRVDELLNWQRALNKRTADEITQKLASMRRKKTKVGLIIVDSPAYSYAFLVFFNVQNDHVSGLKVGECFNNEWVVPSSVYRIDERYIAERNVPGMQTLSGKKIAVVGCGTIGGYIVDLLVKAGAGTGSGELTLVDKDKLHSQNLGRHLLGFSYLLDNKARALAHYFMANMPDAKIRPFLVDVRHTNLSGMDLIIDATAEGTVASFLSKEYGEKSALMTVWIEGAGVAVGALLRPSQGYACATCLATHNAKGDYSTTMERIPPKFAGQGCEQAYVPFPASVSVKAACLASEMVLDWVAGKFEPTLRTMVIDKTFTSATTMANPEPIEGCPACTT